METVSCEECGEPLTPEEIADPVDKGFGPICCTCECQNHHWQCGWCENCEDEDYEVTHFVVLDTEEAGVPAGLYRILGRPFYMQGMIGGGEILTDRVEKIAELPEARDIGYPCAMLCEACAKKLTQAETQSTESP